MNKLVIANCSLRWGTGLTEIDLPNYQNWGNYSRFRKRVITPKSTYAIYSSFLKLFQPNLGSRYPLGSSIFLMKMDDLVIEVKVTEPFENAKFNVLPLQRKLR
jgi:hypothetical protein